MLMDDSIATRWAILESSARRSSGSGGAKKIGVHAFRLGLFLGHDAPRYQVGQRHIHGLHAVLLAYLHGAGDLMNFSLANQIAHRRGAGEDLQGRSAASNLLLEQRL